MKRKRGGQLTYDREIAHAICARLAEGETLRGICRDKGFPHEATVRGWALDDVDGFGTRYALARQLGLDTMVDELLDIADDGSQDFKLDGHGNPIPDNEHINRSRLRIDARKWYLAKLAPKRYGDRVDVNVGGQAENPVAMVFQWQK